MHRFYGVVLSVTLGFFAIAVWAQTADKSEALIRARDLQADAKEAQAKRIPIVLFSNLTDCHYCRGALREVLLPMQRDAGWARTAMYRQIDVDTRAPLIDFDGKPTTHEAFAKLMKLSFTPTVLVVDGQGKTLSDPVVGVANWDFYGTYVETAVRKGFDHQQSVIAK
jgi:thioredoxin-related protein